MSGWRRARRRGRGAEQVQFPGPVEPDPEVPHAARTSADAAPTEAEPEARRAEHEPGGMPDGVADPARVVGPAGTAVPEGAAALAEVLLTAGPEEGDAPTDEGGPESGSIPEPGPDVPEAAIGAVPEQTAESDGASDTERAQRVHPLVVAAVLVATAAAVAALLLLAGHVL